jgi:hypothetical protein
MIAKLASLILILALATCQMPLRRFDNAALAADDWFELAVEIQKHEDQLDKEDRAFVRFMVNWLTIDGHALPTIAQRKWLLDIKRRTTDAHER